MLLNSVSKDDILIVSDYTDGQITTGYSKVLEVRTRYRDEMLCSADCADFFADGVLIDCGGNAATRLWKLSASVVPLLLILWVTA